MSLVADTQCPPFSSLPGSILLGKGGLHDWGLADAVRTADLFGVSGWISDIRFHLPDNRISGLTVEPMMRTSNEQTFFLNPFNKYYKCEIVTRNVGRFF